VIAGEKAKSTRPQSATHLVNAPTVVPVVGGRLLGGIERIETAETTERPVANRLLRCTAHLVIWPSCSRITLAQLFSLHPPF
jgi:hypothetical protein